MSASKKKVVRRPHRKGVFMIGRSPVSGKIYAGLVRNSMFIGKKTDVTTSFITTMLQEHTIKSSTGDEYVITIRKMK